MEEAQDLTVANTGQPLAVVIDHAETFEDAQIVVATPPNAVTVEITPAE